jgi:signal transduction histidine kinase
MFVSVGRRLALVNVAVVLAVTALVGLATFGLLRQSLDREADTVLADRASTAADSWEELFTSSPPLATPAASAEANGNNHDQQKSPHDDKESHKSDDHDHDEAQDLVESGDALLFAVDMRGSVLANARGLDVPGLPDPASIAAAREGEPDARTITIEGEAMRVYTLPVDHDDRLIGFVQAARSTREHQEELRLVGMMSLAGIGLGAIVALPVGLYLARRAMQPIEHAFARQRAFVADASHELRTPLTLIRATTELAQRLPDASPAVREELTGVLDEVDATSRLVDDLLLLARLDSNDLPLRREVVDLGPAIAAAAAPFAPLAEAAGLSLDVEAPRGPRVSADPDRLRQVLRILLDNAIAYTPSGGTIRVGVADEGARARVTVQDTGPGIPAAEQARIFDRFYRADPARARATGGTGLGLAIARALVQAQQGEIGVESQPGRGTTVWFTLPLHPDHHA